MTKKERKKESTRERERNTNNISGTRKGFVHVDVVVVVVRCGKQLICFATLYRFRQEYIFAKRSDRTSIRMRCEAKSRKRQMLIIIITNLIRFQAVLISSSLCFATQFSSTLFGSPLLLALLLLLFCRSYFSSAIGNSIPWLICNFTQLNAIKLPLHIFNAFAKFVCFFLLPLCAGDWMITNRLIRRYKHIYDRMKNEKEKAVG